MTNSPFVSLIKSNLKPISPIPTETTFYSSLRKPIKTILFDIYGTLLVSGTGDVGSDFKNKRESELIQETFNQYGYEYQFTNEALLTQLIHESHKASKINGIHYPEVNIVRIWKQLLEINSYPDAVEDTCKQMALYYELKNNPVWPMPDMKHVLLTLMNTFNLGIISNAQFYTLELMNYFLEDSLWNIGFQRELSSFSFEKGYAKPEIQLFSDIKDMLQSIHCSPQETVYIGNDQLKDIYAANQVGFQTILFAGDKRSLRRRETDEVASSVKADAEISSLTQLLTLLD